MFCKKCGTEIKAGLQFCPRCGTRANQMVNLPDSPKEKGYIKIPRKLLVRISAAVLVAVLIISLGIVLKNVIKREPAESGDPEQPAVQEPTLDEQLSLLGEYMDTSRSDKAEELISDMMETHYDDPALYLGIADLMTERDEKEAAVEILITGYQGTKDEQIKSRLLELQTSLWIGDEAAERISQALDIAEDIAVFAGYDDRLEAGKKLFDTIYGYYLDNK